MNLETAKPVLFMDIEGTLYPVSMTQEQYELIEMACRLMSPINVVKDKPQGKVVNLLEGKS